MALALDGAESRSLMAFLSQRGAATFLRGDGGANTAMCWTPEFVSMLRSFEIAPPKIEGEDPF